jgi:hypothetical protein
MEISTYCRLTVCGIVDPEMECTVQQCQLTLRKHLGLKGGLESHTTPQILSGRIDLLFVFFELGLLRY